MTPCVLHNGVEKSDEGGLSCQCANRENVTCKVIMIVPFVLITTHVLSLSLTAFDAVLHRLLLAKIVVFDIFFFYSQLKCVLISKIFRSTVV